MHSMTDLHHKGSAHILSPIMHLCIQSCWFCGSWNVECWRPTTWCSRPLSLSIIMNQDTFSDSHVVYSRGLTRNCQRWDAIVDWTNPSGQFQEQSSVAACGGGGYRTNWANTTIIKPQNQGPPSRQGRRWKTFSQTAQQLESLNPCLNCTDHHVANEHYIHAEMLHSPGELSGAGKSHLCQVCQETTLEHRD